MATLPSADYDYKKKGMKAIKAIRMNVSFPTFSGLQEKEVEKFVT
jgi:hypothetical protein